MTKSIIFRLSLLQAWCQKAMICVGWVQACRLVVFVFVPGENVGMSVGEQPESLCMQFTAVLVIDLRDADCQAFSNA